MSSSVVLQSSSEKLPCTSVDEAISQCLPDDVGQRNRCLFELAMRLKALLPDAELSELRPIVQRWHRQALPVIGTEPFPASWDDFSRAWPAVNHPFGETLAAIVEAAKKAELPDSLAELGYGDATSRRLVLICREMQRKEGDRPFFISCRTAADPLGVDHVAAAKMLRAMVTDGILELIEKGAGNRASRYRYIWEEVTP